MRHLAPIIICLALATATDAGEWGFSIGGSFNASGHYKSAPRIDRRIPIRIVRRQTGYQTSPVYHARSTHAVYGQQWVTTPPARSWWQR